MVPFNHLAAIACLGEPMPSKGVHVHVYVGPRNNVVISSYMVLLVLLPTTANLL